jgi:uncharacterized protein YhaN
VLFRSRNQANNNNQAVHQYNRAYETAAEEADKATLAYQDGQLAQARARNAVKELEAKRQALSQRLTEAEAALRDTRSQESYLGSAEYGFETLWEPLLETVKQAIEEQKKAAEGERQASTSSPVALPDTTMPQLPVMPNVPQRLPLNGNSPVNPASNGMFLNFLKAGNKCGN